jgi:quinol monooxygenase YgiN
MIAILRAKPGGIEAMRAAITELVIHVRQEPGCLDFVAYESAVSPGEFYLVETYRDLDAFAAHLDTDHVRRFVSSLPEFSVSGPNDLIQLDELPTP